MPRWGEHIIIANKVYNKISNKIDLDFNLFLFGNIIPDVQDGYLVKNISNIVDHKINHYDYNDKKVFENFYDNYKENIKNSIFLGYFTHLATDYLWNKKFDEKCIFNNSNFLGYYDINNNLVKCSVEDAGKQKQKDFEIFENYIFKEYSMKLPKYKDSIVYNCNLIKNININNDDILKIIEYINNLKEKQAKNYKMKIFTTVELEKYIEYTVDTIINYYENIQIMDGGK